MERWHVRGTQRLMRCLGWTVVMLTVLLGCHAEGEGTQMGKFDPLILFSRVQGVVLDHGVPVVDAELRQKIVWDEDEANNVEVRTRTDARGHFILEPITHPAGMTRLVPHQPMTLQTISIRHDGHEYIAWKHGKLTYDANSELKGKPILLICDLSNPPKQEDDHYGICRVTGKL